MSYIIAEITNRYEKKFAQTDSIIIIQTSANCKITKWGCAKNDEKDIIAAKR